MSNKKSSSVPRVIALCYVRQSVTRNADDVDSPERQRANILAVCTARGWIPEFYTDAEGHKSAYYEENRPGWMRLKLRIGDPDVVAIVANDPNRIHRRFWRTGQLLDMVEVHNLNLVFASPTSPIKDIKDPRDKLFLQIYSLMDENYVLDVSRKQQDSVAYRKSLGISVGLPPFGTLRDETGYLVSGPYGAWLLPDGTHVGGKEGDEPPTEGALWRGYFAAAEKVLSVYAENKHGREVIARHMNREGWAFRDRSGQPAPFDGDDIRRITCNWREYAGLVVGGRAKDKTPATEEEPEIILIETGHNVFDMGLLWQVAQVQTARTVTTNKISPKRVAHDYALTGILYCAHCEEDAKTKKTPLLRSAISGHKQGSKFRYRHKEGHPCRANNRSVPMDVIENDFTRLINLLTIDESALPLMTELAIQSEQNSLVRESEIDPEEEKQQAIARCRRRIDAARHLYEDGDLTREEYLKRKEDNEREIAHWESRTTATEQAALELALCMETVAKLAHLWNASSGEDRQGMAQSLFEYVVYDLDARRIKDFRLKPWADKFLVLRSELYDNPPDGTKGDDQENTIITQPTVEGTTVFGPSSPVGASHSSP